MRGYRIIGLTEKAVKHLRKYKGNIKTAVVTVVCEEPFTISVLFKKRYRLVNFIKEDVIHLWAQREMPFCQKGIDYNIEVLR